MPTKSTRSLTASNGRPAVRSERHRESIRVGLAIRYLHGVVDGSVEPDSTRVNAAKFLISKVIPEPKHPVELDAFGAAKDITHRDPHHLIAIIEGEAERKAG